MIHSLADIVSKNGNLLLNVTLLPDGSLPRQMETFLRDMADWTKINGDAIFATRPWAVFGEGPTGSKAGGSFHENFKFTAQDIRFTRKGDDIFAITLGVPDRGTGDPRPGPGLCSGYGRTQRPSRCWAALKSFSGVAPPRALSSACLLRCRASPRSALRFLD